MHRNCTDQHNNISTKYTTTQNLHEQLKPGFVTSHYRQHLNGMGIFLKK